jgi:hypothetical protein
MHPTRLVKQATPQEGNLNRKFLSAFLAPSQKHSLACFGSRSNQKAVGFGSFSFIWMICE